MTTSHDTYTELAEQVELDYNGLPDPRQIDYPTDSDIDERYT